MNESLEKNPWEMNNNPHHNEHYMKRVRSEIEKSQPKKIWIRTLLVGLKSLIRPHGGSSEVVKNFDPSKPLK